ncbi:substrate-binding domain-containing protein [Kitasatospora sp. NPDC056327]|uniref:substrate-binding domain-containing protein n=1 Tax=Kitasatospora sp. NPDC056327 TaxID=3345785 RepID=UPI0035D53A25
MAARVMTGLAAAVCAAAVSAPAAVADPEPGGLPAPADLVGVGVDTTQWFMTQTSTDYNASIPPVQRRLYGFDATGSSPIVPKTGAPVPIARPDGTRPGAVALAATTTASLDYSRASRGPEAGDPPGLSFVGFAKDAVTWAARSGGNAPADLTATQLRNIYECTSTTWSQINPAWPNTTIRPYLPPPASDTRAAFLKALGGGVTPVAPGGCVTSGPRNDRGTDPALNDPDVVFPYSVGRYVDQVYRGHATSLENPGTLTVRSINGIAPVGAGNSISGTFHATLFGRILRNVVRTSEYTSANAHGAALLGVFGPSGFICQHPATIVAQGFVPIPNCSFVVTT